MMNEILSHQFAQDIPHHYARPLGTLHILSAPDVFSLREPKRLSLAKDVLQQLDLSAILGDREKQSLRSIDHKIDSNDYSATNSVSQIGKGAVSQEIPPLIVDMEGFLTQRNMESHAIHLSTRIVDHSHRLRVLQEAIKGAFRMAGFAERSPAKYSTAAPSALLGYRPTEVVRLFNTVAVDRDVPSEKHPGYMRRQYGPPMDVRDLIDQCRNKVWMENIRLDRVSLCRLGIAAKILRGAGGIDSGLELEEDFSVPLP